MHNEFTIPGLDILGAITALSSPCRRTLKVVTIKSSALAPFGEPQAHPDDERLSGS